MVLRRLLQERQSQEHHDCHGIDQVDKEDADHRGSVVVAC
jgi:hypothetical protein